MICLSCSSILQEVQNLLEACYRFQNQIDYGSDEVRIFIQEIHNCSPTITGARVCNINSQMLHAFLASIVSYFVIVVQFDKTYVSKRTNNISN